MNCIQKKPHAVINEITTIELWKPLELSFISPRNFMFDRYLFFSRKQKGETVEQHYSILKVENCNFKKSEELVIRDVLITNMSDTDIQRDLLNESDDPTTTLQTAIKVEMGQQNQLEIKTVTQLANNNVQNSSSLWLFTLQTAINVVKMGQQNQLEIYNVTQLTINEIQNNISLTQSKQSVLK